MLIFWIIAVLLCAGVAAFILWPIWKESDESEPAEHPDLAIYRSQLDELKKDVASGAIDEAEAAAAEAEISRRLLAAGAEDEKAKAAKGASLSSRQRIALAVLIGLVLPAGAIGLYALNGHPQYGSQPYAGKEAEVELRIRYGQAFMQAQQYPDAANAFAEAVVMAPGRADLHEMYGEALLFSGQGEISEEAVAQFRRAIEIDPTRVRSRYVIGEWLYRNGRPEDGARMFIDLMEETEDPKFRAFLDQRIQGILKELEEIVQNGGELPPHMRANEPKAETPLDTMSDEQKAMVNQMVSGLAARLEEEPDDLEGWLRLIRSYAVLGETEKANAAVQTATLTFLTNPEALKQIIALTEETGLVRGPDLPEEVKRLEAEKKAAEADEPEEEAGE